METLQRASEILGVPRTTLDYYRLTGKITTHPSGRIHLVELGQLIRELEAQGHEGLRSKIEPLLGELHLKKCPCCNALIPEDLPLNETEQETTCNKS